MKSILSIVLFSLLTTVAFSQQKGGFGIISSNSQNQLPDSKGMPDNTISKALTLKDYSLELFPGQVFDGWYFFWSYSGQMGCTLNENPEADWLSISPKQFISTGCTDIIPVRFTFTAPADEGVYETTLIDPTGNWSALKVNLKVTNSPVNSVKRKFGIFDDTVAYNYYLMNRPFSWSDNTCVSDYFMGDSLSFNFKINPAVSWCRISPLTGRIYKNEKQDFQTTIKKRTYDSTWVVLTRKSYSFPSIYHYYVKSVEPKESLLHFNGTNGINTAYFLNSATRTLMFWVRFDSIQSDQLCGVNDGENHRFYLGIQKNNTFFAGLGNSYTPLTNLNLIPGKWYHMAMTTSADNDSAKVYINATEVSRFRYLFSGESKSHFTVGVRNDFEYLGRYIKGYLEEVQVWERPLSRSEIIKYMFSPPAFNEDNLVINYTFSEGWGDFTKNIANNYYSGVFFNEPQWIDTIRRPANISEIIVSVEKFSHNSENTISLTCKPNPFTSATEITYNLVGTGKALLELYDIRGVMISTLRNENVISGTSTFNLNDVTIPAGIYYIRLIVTSSQGIRYKSIKLVKTD